MPVRSQRKSKDTAQYAFRAWYTASLLVSGAQRCNSHATTANAAAPATTATAIHGLSLSSMINLRGLFGKPLRHPLKEKYDSPHKQARKSPVHQHGDKYVFKIVL